MRIRTCKTLVALALVVSITVHAETTVEQPAAEQPAPKIIPFVWTLVSAVAQQAFPYFLHWLTSSRVSSTVSGAGLNPATVQPYVTDTNPLALGRAIITTLESLIGKIHGPTAKEFSQVSNPVIVGEPDIPLKVSADGQANYQGVHLAVVSVDTAAGTSRFRALSDGFHTGERFKLRLVATFDAAVVIDATNPSSVRSRLYPAAAEQVVFIKAGQTVLLPLENDQFFEFANQTGNEQLLITARDPRGIADGLSSQPIYRQDEEWGTNLLQLTPPGSYAGFTQVMALKHVAANL